MCAMFARQLTGYEPGVGLRRKVDVRLHGKGNSNSHGARPVHLIVTIIKWIRTSRMSTKDSLAVRVSGFGFRV